MASVEQDTASAVWQDPSESGGTGGAGTWMRLKRRPEPYRVRLVSSPEIFRSHYAGVKTVQHKGPVISPVLGSDGSTDWESDILCREGGWIPGKRYAFLVIDRETGSVRIMEVGGQVFGPISDYAKLKRVNPASNSGPDWLISVGVDSQGKTKYGALADGGPVPFTPGERAMIEACKIDLKKVYRRKTADEMVAIWNSIPEGGRVNPQAMTKEQWKARKAGVTADVQPVQVQQAMEPVRTPDFRAPAQQATVAPGETTDDTTFLAPKAKEPAVPAIGEKKAVALF